MKNIINRTLCKLFGHKRDIKSSHIGYWYGTFRTEKLDCKCKRCGKEEIDYMSHI